MLPFIMLNMTLFNAENGCASCVQKNPMCCPNAPRTGVHWDTFFPTNISNCVQDPQALDSLKCRYYIEVQTGIPVAWRSIL